MSPRLHICRALSAEKEGGSAARALLEASSRRSCTDTEGDGEVEYMRRNKREKISTELSRYPLTDWRAHLFARPYFHRESGQLVVTHVEVGEGGEILEAVWELDQCVGAEVQILY